MKKEHYRMALVLAAYDPYKDVFDIFYEQFKKNWPDCPYPLVVANMHFDVEGDNVIVIHCGDEPALSKRFAAAIDAVDADYYLGFEEDRMIMSPVDTAEIGKILDFMDKENVPYYRCNPSSFRKKARDRFPGYEHYYHVIAREPYGVCGATCICSKEMMSQLREQFGLNGYKFETYQNERAALSKERWADNYATDDRNIFHIMHCVDKQRWIPGSRKRLIKEGYTIRDEDRKVLTAKQVMIFKMKGVMKVIPGKARHVIKSFLKKFGAHFETDY